MAGDASQHDAAARRRADLKLVRQVLRGEARAEAALLDRLLPHLRAVARAITPNASDIDDATQIALMRVLEGLPTYRGDASLVRWSRRVAAHACLRLREQDRRRLHVVEPDAEAEALAPQEDHHFGDGLVRPMTEYLDQLPAVQREVLVLRHVLDHSVAEIAQLCGAPIDTVKSRLLYARRALRKLIRRDRLAAPAIRREGAGG